ncbi:MAG: hypothetical protein VKJ06_07135 [Vampirovibrionales bacterium]|nr:hypothetical protein [Vampirovibrionales bacterium]
MILGAKNGVFETLLSVKEAGKDPNTVPTFSEVRPHKRFPHIVLVSTNADHPHFSFTSADVKLARPLPKFSEAPLRFLSGVVQRLLTRTGDKPKLLNAYKMSTVPDNNRTFTDKAFIPKGSLQKQLLTDARRIVAQYQNLDLYQAIQDGSLPTPARP